VFTIIAARRRLKYRRTLSAIPPTWVRDSLELRYLHLPLPLRKAATFPRFSDLVIHDVAAGKAPASCLTFTPSRSFPVPGSWQDSIRSILVTRLTTIQRLDIPSYLHHPRDTFLNILSLITAFPLSNLMQLILSTKIPQGSRYQLLGAQEAAGGVHRVQITSSTNALAAVALLAEIGESRYATICH
jgi:hypothetical protein